MNKSDTVQITKPPTHHFFGFHDLLISNFNGDKLLSLEVDEIDHAPYPGQTAGIGYVNLPSGEFIRIGETSAWNFPQGARQQWINDSDIFLVNNRYKNTWIADIYDSNINKMIDRLALPVHTLNTRTGDAYCMDYSRLHRLGGYGYIGLDDRHINEPAPQKSGIMWHNIRKYESQLLISLWDIAHHESKMSVNYTEHHYATHLLLNPSGTRLGFLHRFRIPDGGEITRLMSISANGTDLRCLASGFLSHFDWLNDKQIMIWGNRNQLMSNIRTSNILNNKYIRKIAVSGKNIIKKLFLNKYCTACTFLCVTDDNITSAIPTAPSLNSDGHLMVCPSKRDWLIVDTYPDQSGIRKLLLYNISRQKLFHLENFCMLNINPNISLIDLAMQGIDINIKKYFSHKLYGFTRSGLHCDLHPRWLANGTQVAIDSIHEGTRQIYILDLKKYMQQ
jgi:hypothetical protein